MKKRGFTLIEIIISISIITVIGVGSIVGIKYFQKKQLDKEIEKTYKQFDVALEVYLSNNYSIYKNLKDNVEGAVVTLEVLKNEGLVSDKVIDPITNLPLDYKNSYYVLSDAVLLSDEEETTCDGQVGLNVLKSWTDLSGNVDTSDIIYICPKSSNDDSAEKIKKLEERINELEYSLSLSNLGGNSYVVFDVDNSNNDIISWNDKDLWRLVSIDDGIKLMYDQPIRNNFTYNTNDILSDFKNLVPKATNASSCKYIGIGSDDSKAINALLLKDINVKFIDYDSNSYCKTYNFDDGSGPYSDCYVYNGEIYCENGNDYKKINSSTPVLNATSECNNNNVTIAKGKTKYIENGPVEKWLFHNCYVKKSTLNNYILNKSIIKFIYPDALDDTGYYNLKDLFSLNYYSIFSYNSSTTGSVRNKLKNKIDSNLSSAIVKNNYYYSYDIKNDSMISMKTDTFNDFLGILRYDEAEEMIKKDPTIFVGKNVMLGKATESGETLVLTYRNTSVSSAGQRIEQLTGKNNKLYELGVASYHPVILIKPEYKLLFNIEEYPDSYSKCKESDLGTKDCPYLIKIDNYYSNGDSIS